ncbi:MAG: alpha/beta hydrolase [Bdellovibrio sp. CG10_big_fil_rev_8_21_14_0_10_47_8]|nr:MAG: alpha/beta hydrolase [Bdellovibrio sp. CG10_big_fil_rev_8_21_14_0_10_47_8]
MKKFFIPIVAIFMAGALSAETHSTKGYQGYVALASKAQIYVDWTYAQPGKPTVILINGLTYSTEQWKKMAEALVAEGLGVFRYDPQNMGKTLTKAGPALEKMPIESQVADLKELLTQLSVPKPYNLVGLSYGGGLSIYYAATYPKDMGKLIPIAPYTEPIRSQDEWIRSQIWFNRKTVPWNQSSDDELYDFFLHQMVYAVYPSAEPIVLSNPYMLEATFRLAQGIRHFRAADVVHQLPDHALNLIIAGRDQYVTRETMEDFWKVLPDRKQGSRIILQNSEHKVPEAAPHFAAALVEQILENDRLFSGGRSFEADPWTGVLKYEGGSLKLPREN